MNNLASPFIMVIFGASGDLTSRKLIPALFKLYCNGLFPEKFVILGVSRTYFSDESFRDKMHKNLESTIIDSKEKYCLSSFVSNIFYFAMDTRDEHVYSLLSSKLEEFTGKLEIAPNYLFYLATPPNMYSEICKSLAKESLQKEKPGKYWRRIIVEKPYGKDISSAKDLDKVFTGIFKESQIYRIDHYLGKETVQNILVFRFSNGIFEPLWNRNYINYVEITAVEKLGVLDRAGYYDGAGALRDMVQNHLMQLLGIMAMEPPAKFNEQMFRDEVHKVIESLRPITEEDVSQYVVRGQYVSPSDNNTVKGYRDENGINPDSRTETFVAMKLFIDNWRWSGVPFFIRTGKAMPTKVSEIVIHFNSTPYELFEKQCTGLYCNKLIIRILPDEGIVLEFGLKEPGSSFEVRQVSMDFKYDSLSEGKRLPEAYERLLLDCIMGDPMLYSRTDTVEASWKFLDPVLKSWENDENNPLYGYPVGTWGPIEQEKLMTDGRTWTNPCKNLTNNKDYCLL
ncbi:MAG: glucose-6-phosphate dehydrogenase [Bacteroidales bacterium]|nr:glucose-6-phosphate dehydrogenase [Bacteroidales bacterium]